MRSLRAYILVLAAAFAVLLAGAAALLLRQAGDAGRAQTQAQMLETVRALSLVLDGKLHGYEQLLRALGASGAAQRRDFTALDRQARQALQEPEAWIVLTERDGRQRVNTRLPEGARLLTFPMAPAVWAELDRGQARFSNLRRGGLAPQTLRVDLPIMEGGRARYVLSVVFQPRLLQRILQAQRVPGGRYAFILDREGTILWRNVAPESSVGTRATPDLLSLLRSQSEGTTASHSLEGVATELAFSRSPASGWVFGIAVPRAEFAAEATRTLRDGALVVALFVLGAIGAAAFAARAVTRDIARLAAAGARIRAGQPPAFERSRFQEFSDLAALLAGAIGERDDLRERFAPAQEVGGVGAWDWDSLRDEGRVSETYKRMHGLTGLEGPLKFKQVLEVVHPDDLHGYLERLAAAKTRREPSTNEYRVMRPDGSIAWVQAKGRPIFDDMGRLIGSIGVVRDATAEHEAEDTLRRLNELLERQVEARTLERDRLWNLAQDPFVVADERAVWLTASPAWTALLGYPLEDFLGRTSEWLEHPDDAAKSRAQERRLAAGEMTERFENRFRAKDGSYRWLSWSAVPADGRFYAVARDVTAEKAQAEALKQAETALRQSQKMEAIGQITGGVAHDFNNLLTPIVATLDFLRIRGLGDARAERMVGNAIEAAERSRKLVQQLLAFARRQPLRTGALDVGACLERLGSLLETSLGAQVRLTIETDEDLPPIVADANQLELAILNLAVNARDAMPEGGKLTIRARSRELADGGPEGLIPGRYVEIAVTDTGAGMAPNVVERAIEPFFSTKGLGRGTGLGLSMAHGLMAQLGGGLGIESTLGQGTTIRLWLRTSETAPPAPVAAPARALAVPPSGRALLVDDEALARAGAAQMLADLGYEAVEAGTAEDALRRLEAETFDVLVTDHLMPGMSGAELARIVRERWPAVRLLVVSGYTDVDDIAPDLPRLSKPFRQSELAEALTRLAELGCATA